MDSVLVVSSSEKGLALLKELLTQSSYPEIVTTKSSSQAKRLLLERNFDLCIINAPLADDFGTNFALNVASGGFTQVLLIVKSEICDEVAEKVEDAGVFTISKPMNRQFFWTALKLITAAHKRLLGLKNDNLELNKKIEDIRLINRAKCVLIQHFKFTEAEAHRYIEKQAMNLRKTKKDVAADILKNQ